MQLNTQRRGGRKRLTVNAGRKSNLVETLVGSFAVDSILNGYNNYPNRSKLYMCIIYKSSCIIFFKSLYLGQGAYVKVAHQCRSSLDVKTSTDGAVCTSAQRLFLRLATLTANR